MQVHDPVALEELLESSHGKREPLSGVAGAVPAKRGGVPSAKPLAPRARAAAISAPEDARGSRAQRAERTVWRAVKVAGPCPRTAPARGRNTLSSHRLGEHSAEGSHSDGATALGHTQDLGLKRTFFWPTKVIAVDRVDPIGYRSTVGRESNRVGFWEAGGSGPPGGYSRAPVPAGRKSRSANEIYGYTRRLHAAEQKERRKAERERARADASATQFVTSLPTDEVLQVEPEPEPVPKNPSAQKGSMIYVNTKEAGMQIHYSAHPTAPVYVKVSQFSPTKSQNPQDSDKPQEVIPEDGESQEGSNCDGMPSSEPSPAKTGGDSTWPNG